MLESQINTPSFIKKSICIAQIFTKFQGIVVIYVFGLRGWNLFLVKAYHFIFKTPSLVYFCDFIPEPHSPLNTAAGQQAPLCSSSQSITTTLVVICDHLSGPHLSKLVSLNPPPTKELRLTICLTYNLVDPTLFCSQKLSLICLRFQ